MMVQKLETRGFGRGTDQSQFRDENYSPRTLRPSAFSALKKAVRHKERSGPAELHLRINRDQFNLSTANETWFPPVVS